MGIEVKHGDPGAMGELAILAGEAEAGKRQEKMAYDVATQLRNQAHQVRLEEARVEANLQAREQQFLFDNQKIQMAQENDFMVSEEIRMNNKREEALKLDRKKNEYEASVTAVEEAETLSQEEKERMKLNLQIKYGMGAGAPQFDVEEDALGAYYKAQRESRSQESHEERMRTSPEKDRRAQEKHELYMRTAPVREQRQVEQAYRNQKSWELSQGRSEIEAEYAAQRVARQEAADLRSQETHEKRMADEPSFAEQEAAAAYLEENKEANWLQKLVPGGKGALSAVQTKMREQATAVLQSRTVEAAPTPTTRDEFDEVYMKLFLANPVKAQQYWDAHNENVN